MNYITEHIKLVIAICVLILLLLLGALFYVSRKQNSNANSNQNNVSNSGYILDSNNNFLADNNISDQDKYLMLLGQQMTENFGTNQLGDARPLLDLQNQSADSFKSKVESMISSLDKSQNVTTSVDTSTIKINKQTDNSVTVTMNATTNDLLKNTKSNISSKVELLKQGEFWLVTNITFSNR